MMTETVTSTYTEPDNVTTVDYMRREVIYLGAGFPLPKKMGVVEPGSDDLDFDAWYVLQEGAA